MTTPGSSPCSAPDEVDPDRLRRAMGRFATGVTVITTRDRSGRAFGSTANAVSSVSLRPPLVLACLREESEPPTLRRSPARASVPRPAPAGPPPR